MEFAKMDSRVKVGFVCLKSFLKEGDARHFDDYLKEIYGSLLEFKDYWSKHEGDIPTLNAFSMILTQVKFYQKSLKNLSSTRIVSSNDPEDKKENYEETKIVKIDIEYCNAINILIEDLIKEYPTWIYKCGEIIKNEIHSDIEIY